MPPTSPPNTDDPYELSRFVSAQSDSYAVALSELKSGAKRSHWMWYVFPQFAGLGTSAMATRYAIQSRQEAAAYLTHPLLGARLIECTKALLGVTGKTAEQVMGRPDDLKLRSSMTLFAAISPAGSVFHQVLDRYFTGAADERTLEYLKADA
jgi:uncharacterized protein (DUF1810 family)